MELLEAADPFRQIYFDVIYNSASKDHLRLAAAACSDRVNKQGTVNHFNDMQDFPGEMNIPDNNK